MRALALAALLCCALPTGAQEAATPWIGVVLSNGADGIEVKEVLGDAPAERAGLRPGDRILELDGREVATSLALIEGIQARGVGQTVSLGYRRAGKAATVRLVLEPRPDMLERLRARLIGKPAPDFALEQARGPHAARLGALRGNVVVLEFWATWCGPCLESIPRLSAWQRRWGARGLRVVGISSEPWATVTARLGRRKVGYTVASDPEGEVPSRYGVEAIPTLVVIGRDGRVLHVDVGAGQKLDDAERVFLPLVK